MQTKRPLQNKKHHRWQSKCHWLTQNKPKGSQQMWAAKTACRRDTSKPKQVKMEARGKPRNKSTAGTWYAALFMTTVEALQHLLFADCTVTNRNSGFNSLPLHTLNHCQSSRSSVQSVTRSTSRKRFYFAYNFDIESASWVSENWYWNRLCSLLTRDTHWSLCRAEMERAQSAAADNTEGLSHIFSSLATVAAKVQWPCDFFQSDHTQGDRIASWGLKEKINWRVGSMKTGTGSLFSIYSKLLTCSPCSLCAVLTCQICTSAESIVHVMWLDNKI